MPTRTFPTPSASNLGWFLLVWAYFVAGCDRQKLPESYGVYIRDRGKLVRLDANTLEADQRDFSENCSMLIYDRWLAQPFVQAEQIAKVLERRYIRYNVQRQPSESRTTDEEDVVVTPANEFAAFGRSIDCALVPIKGENEMIEVRPRQPLAKGLYYLEVADKRLPFGVKLGNTSEARSPDNGALDRYSEATTSAPKFSWDNWPNTSRRRTEEPFRLPSRLYDSADDTSYQPASVLESSIQQWKNSVETLVAQKDFTKAARIVRRLRNFDAQDNRYVDHVKEGLQRAARDALAKRPEVALAYANRLQMTAVADAKAAETAKDAAAKLQAWNEQQAKLKQDWERTARDPGQTLYSANFITKQQAFMQKEEQRGTSTLNESFLVNEWVTGRDRRERNEIWLGEIQKVSTSSKRELVDMMPTKHKDYYYIEIKAAEKTAKLTFGSEFERVALLQKLEEARSAFDRRTSPSTRATVGNVHAAVQGDEVVYDVELDLQHWSPPIEVPQTLAAVEWSDPPGGSSYDIQEDGVGRSAKESFVPRPGSQLAFRGWPRKNRPFKITMHLR